MLKIRDASSVPVVEFITSANDQQLKLRKIDKEVLFGRRCSFFFSKNLTHGNTIITSAIILANPIIVTMITMLCSDRRWWLQCAAILTIVMIVTIVIIAIIVFIMMILIIVMILVIVMITMRGDRREEAAKKQTLTPLFSNTAPPQTFSWSWWSVQAYLHLGLGRGMFCWSWKSLHNHWQKFFYHGSCFLPINRHYQPKVMLLKSINREWKLQIYVINILEFSKEN